MSKVTPDDRIEALYDADNLWDYGIMEDDYRRIMSAKAINFLEVFSLKQLALIARCAVKDLTEAGCVEYTENAGRLNPESIKTLRLLYATWRTGKGVSFPLLSIILRDGTDLQAVHQITGIPMEELE